MYENIKGCKKFPIPPPKGNGQIVQIELDQYINVDGS